MKTMLFTCLLALLVTRGLSSTLSIFTDDTASAITCSGSDVIFENHTRSISHCAFQCFMKKCCYGYLYTDTSGACVGCRIQATSGTALSSPEGGTVYFRKKDGEQWEYFEGSHYAVFSEGQTYSDAKEYCSGLCGYPVHVESQTELDFLKTIVKDGGVYIGLEHVSLTTSWIDDLGFLSVYNRTFEWRWAHERSQLTLSNWKDGEPAGGLNQGCAMMASADNWKWSSVFCNNKRRFVCERT